MFGCNELCILGPPQCGNLYHTPHPGDDTGAEQRYGCFNVHLLKPISATLPEDPGAIDHGIDTFEPGHPGSWIDIARKVASN